MNCNTTHYRANSSSVPGDPTPYFLKHYSRYFSPRHVHVIDHGSEPGLVPAEYNKISVPSNRPFSEWARARLVTSIASGLLEYYDAGIYVDCDELICLDRLKEVDFDKSPVTHVAGFDVYWADTPEGKKLFGLLNKDACKPLIFSRTPNWTPGFHRSGDLPGGSLIMPMAHVRYLFRKEAGQRLRERAEIYNSMNGSEKNVGIDFHWSKGEGEVKAFYRNLGRFEDKSRAVPFTEIDPFRIDSLVGHPYDLTPYFPALF